MLNRWRRILQKKWRKALPYLVAYLGEGLLRLILITCRIKVHGLPSFLELAAKEPCILMLWHNRLTLMPFFISKYASQFNYTAVISNSRDGEMLATIARKYPNANVIRIAHHSRHHGLRDIIKQLKEKKPVLLITPDGPRGPCYQIKPGILLAAKTADAAIIPFNWQCNHVWRLKTWDSLIIPKPFSQISFCLGKPIKVIDNELHDLKFALDSCRKE